MLVLPVYATEASGEFCAGGFVVGDTGAAMSVTRTIFGARAIYVIMWAGHGLFFNSLLSIVCIFAFWIVATAVERIEVALTQDKFASTLGTDTVLNGFPFTAFVIVFALLYVLNV